MESGFTTELTCQLTLHWEAVISVLSPTATTVAVSNNHRVKGYNIN